MWLNGAGLLAAAGVIAAARVEFCNQLFPDPLQEPWRASKAPSQKCSLWREQDKLNLPDTLQLPEQSETKRDLPFTGPVQGPLAYSPPSYPSPWGAGSGDWADAYTKARALVSQMTLLEKVNLTTGVGLVKFLVSHCIFTKLRDRWEGERCVGQTGSVPRLGIRSLCLQDSPLG